MGIGNYEGYFSRSGFKTDEAIVMRHMNFDHFLPEIEVLKAQGVYPIREPKYLHWRHEIPLEPTVPSICSTLGTLIFSSVYVLWEMRYT